MPDPDAADQPVPALDQDEVWRLATAYLARFAASTDRLRRVLERQVRRWHERRGPLPPEPARVAAMIAAAVTRAQELALVDDRSFALARASRLLARGLPEAEVRRRLRAERLDASLDARDDAAVADDASQARLFAQRKRLGPFRLSRRDGDRDKDIRRLLRAGFALRDAVAAIDGDPDEGAE